MDAGKQWEPDCYIYRLEGRREILKNSVGISEPIQQIIAASPK